MISYYIKHAFRFILKNKSFSFINLTGLIIGILSFLILFNYLFFEFSYDHTIPDYNNIYRIVTDVPQQNGNIMNTAMSSGYFSRSAEGYFDDIIASTRITPSFKTLLNVNEKQSYEENFWYADSSFFKVFNLKLIQGNPNEVLNGPFKIVISQKLAKKYFGNSNPVNQVVNIHNRWEYTISGVFKDLPSNMHLSIDILATPDSINSFKKKFWGALGLFSYIKIKDNVDPKILEQDFRKFTIEKMGEKWADVVQFKLQAVKDIHLRSDRLHEVSKVSNLDQLYYLLGVALLILLMAGINYINIYTSRAEYRSKEVGLKKVIGAQRKQLIYQFISESLLFTTISIVISFFLLLSLWTYFEQFIETKIQINTYIQISISLAILVIIGLLAGMYPAIYLSSFKPIFAIKSLHTKKKGGSFFRRILVVFQFVIAMLMIFATLVVFQQMNFIKKKDLGFDQSNILVSGFTSNHLISRNTELKSELSKLKNVNDIAFSSSHINNILSGQRGYTLEDTTTVNNAMSYMIRTITVDENFIPLYDMKINTGRNFSADYSTDHNHSIIINQATSNLIGLNAPIGTRLLQVNQDTNYVYNIIGVLDNFNYQSLHIPVEPLIFTYSSENFPTISIKVNETDFYKTKREIEKKMNELSPDFPVDVTILAEDIQENYSKEKKISTLYAILTSLSIIIACLGLFGMVSFLLEKKTKSVGIRKVLGATDRTLFYILSKELIYELIVATLIALPTGYIIMKKWLQEFAYKIEISWWIFAVSFLLLFAISLITVSYKTYKTIKLNPANTLRYE